MFNLLKFCDIDFIQEKSFDWDVEKYKRRYDFYIPSLNTIIELNGKQHYEPVIFGDFTHDEAVVKYEELVQREGKVQVQSLLKSGGDELQDQLRSVPKVLRAFHINELLHLCPGVDDRLHGLHLNLQL